MAYHPRIETEKYTSFVTSRTRNQALWLANNPQVERFTLGLLAKLKERRRPKLYAFAIEGSHLHTVADFPLKNRADFCRDLNSGVAKAVRKYTPHYPGGSLWGRRYSVEYVPAAEDVEKQFFYTVLQPVQDGLVEKLSDYPFYNCFHDAVCGIERKFKLVNWTKYNSAKRFNEELDIKDYVETYVLKYDRLPGYEDMGHHEYKVMMEKKLEEYRLKVIEERKSQGKKGFLGRAALLRTVPGRPAKSPKVSTIDSHRPRVLSVSNERRAAAKKWYFEMYFWYKEASRRYRAGEIGVQFPPGMYLPPSWQLPKPEGPYSVL